MDLWVLAAFLIAFIQSTSADDEYKVIRSELQQNVNNSRRLNKRECVVLIIETEYDDHHHVEELACELQGEDRNGRKYKEVRVNGLTAKWAEKNNITSGISTIFTSSEAHVNLKTNELVIPSNAVIKVGRRKNVGSATSLTNLVNPDDLYWNRNLRTGVKTVLVVRVKAKDSKTTATESELADKVFGVNVDRLNLKSGFLQCSNNQLLFEPITSDTIIGTDGVYTVNLPNTNVAGRDKYQFADLVLDQLERDFQKSAHLIADHVMFCLPPGTEGTWVAYGYVNQWRTVYNNERCTHPSVQLHELGHSSEGDSEYGDISGFMGSSQRTDDSPFMCFNGVKTWHLGWYNGYHVDLPFDGSFNWEGDLVGFAEHGTALPSSDRMIIRIRSSKDYYIHFNRKIGMNSETREGGDQVLIASRSSGTEYAASFLQAKLNAGDKYAISRFNGSTNTLTISVKSINFSTKPVRANVSVRFGRTIAPSSAPTRTPTPVPTFAPTTKAPTLPPTTTPTLVPTLSPTTKAPTKLPTRTPTRIPTLSPTTKAPTLPPTEAPTLAPTIAPTTEDPTAAPSESIIPTTSPSESFAPTLTPSESVVPTSIPSESIAPTSTPSESVVPTTSLTPINASPFDQKQELIQTSEPTIPPSTGSPTSDPTTKLPTRVPTKSPTRAPTSKRPTRVPTSE